MRHHCGTIAPPKAGDKFNPDFQKHVVKRIINKRVLFSAPWFVPRGLRAHEVISDLQRKAYFKNEEPGRVYSMHSIHVSYMIHVYIYVYIYIYIERERERERDIICGLLQEWGVRGRASSARYAILYCTVLYHTVPYYIIVYYTILLYIYIYIHTYIQ